MSEVSKMQQTEAMNKRQTFELRKLGDKIDNELKEVKEKNEKEITKVKKDYEVQVSREKNEAEVKLAKVRESYNKKINEETKRYEKLMNDLKLSQTDRMSEKQQSNEVALATQETKFRESLEKVRQDYEEEKAKLEA